VDGDRGHAAEDGPREGDARALHDVSFTALERQTLVPWPRAVAELRVRDLRDVDWSCAL
jgi:hypothetical protein